MSRSRVHLATAQRLRHLAALARAAAGRFPDPAEPRLVLAHNRLLDAAEDADRAARVIGSGARRWHGKAARYAGTLLGVAATVLTASATGAPWWAACPAVVIVAIAGGRLGWGVYRRIRAVRGRRATHAVKHVDSADPLADARTSIAALRSGLPARLACVPLRALDRGDSTRVDELLWSIESMLCQAFQAEGDERWSTGLHRFPEAAYEHDHGGCLVAFRSGRSARRLRDLARTLLDADPLPDAVAYAVGRLATARDLLLETAYLLDHPPARESRVGRVARDAVSVLCGLVLTAYTWLSGTGTAVMASGFVAATVTADVAGTLMWGRSRDSHGTPGEDCAAVAEELAELADGPAETAATAAARRNAQVAAEFVRAAAGDLAVTDATPRFVETEPNPG